MHNRSQTISPVRHTLARPRDLRLDFARGIALWFIFLDHIPNNAGEWLTLKNYGFSDTTEIFFFVSGYTCALAYGATLRDRGFLICSARSMRRAWEIYVGFVMLVFIFAAIIFTVSGADRSALDQTNIAVLFENPGEAIMRASILSYMPVNTDVLPTFVLMHLLCAPLLVLLNRAPMVAVAGSAALYILVHLTGFNLPTWPKGEWFFNPFAWQLLFVCGAWVAMGGAKPLIRWLRSNAALALAVVYLAASAFVALGWQFKVLEAFVPETIRTLIYPVDKSHLDPLRVLHFVSLAVVAMRLMPRDWRWLASAPATAAIRCGEQSLALYCLSVPLAFVAGQALHERSGGVAMQFAVSAFGIVIMIFMAALITGIERAADGQPKLF